MLHVQRGQSYIEIIVVLLLMGIALTGLVISMLCSVHLSRSAIQQLDAVQLASNLSNSLRLNNAELTRDASLYLTSLNTDKKITGSCSARPDCGQRAQALTDLRNWQQQLDLYLPQYLALICRDSSANDGEYLLDDGCDNRIDSPFIIKIWWRNKNAHYDDVLFLALEHAV
ncbi:MAG: type IV pilus modification protein PilV [Oceanospirillaceae bacterium]|nr:type IV pilus modification protein PilV [Oceanospirillaceae bacterium]